MISYILLERKWNNPDTGLDEIITKKIPLEDYNLDLTQNTWIHLGISKEGGNMSVFINTTKIMISDLEFVPETREIIIGDGNSIQLDEMMVDTSTTLDFESFLQSTQDKVPWGTLDYLERHLIIDAHDPDNIKGNLFSGQSFKDAVAQAINEEIAIAKLPKDFIYVQFRDQKSPEELYPGTDWEDISNTYKGRFFRAGGGSAAGFGSQQGGGLPNITGTLGLQGVDGYVNVATGAFATLNTGHVASGTSKSSSYLNRADFSASRSSSLYGAASEVRPINETIRIWKRIA